MATLSLREAAEQAGTSKSTIFRAIKAGRLSAARTEDGGFAIDPAELFRVYPPKSKAVAEERSPQAGTGQDAPADAMAPELATKLAVLETELAGLKALLAEVRANRDELRAERDDWRARADRLLTDQRPRPWWKRLTG
jgi:excisionase family DNA binding protein